LTLKVSFKTGKLDKLSLINYCCKNRAVIVIPLVDEINGLIIARENTKIKKVPEVSEINGNGRDAET
jgi:hypothetical protein